MDEDDKLMMSDSLRGQIPEIEQLEDDDSFVIFALAVRNVSGADVFAGSLVGMAIEPSCTKVELRVETSKAYEFVTSHVELGWECMEYHLQTATRDFVKSGPFNVISPRLMDFDKSSKQCTLGFDLVKVDDI